MVRHLPPTFSACSHYLFEHRASGDLRAENTLFAPTELLRRIGGWDDGIRSWEHDDLLLRLNAVCSLEGLPVVTYLWHRHQGKQRHEDALDSAEGMARTLRKHAGTFALYPRRRAKYLGSMGFTYLRAGRWRSAVAATTRSIELDPWQPRLWLWWFATLTGPFGLAALRAARRSLQTPRGTSRQVAPVSMSQTVKRVSGTDGAS